MQYQYRVTIDPGFNTGVALWDEYEWRKLAPPVATHLFKVPRNTTAEWAGKTEYVAQKVNVLLNSLHTQNVNIIGVFCEMPEFFESGVRGKASARRGDVTHLSYLVGYYGGICHIKKIPYTPVPVRQWIGQLPKEVVQKRIKDRLGKEYPNHIADAVGMGLWLKGFF